MDSRERVWIRDARGVHATAVVPPPAWRQQRACIVGPFSNAQSARAFLLLRHPGGGARVFPAGSAFYVEIL